MAVVRAKDLQLAFQVTDFKFYPQLPKHILQQVISTTQIYHGKSIVKRPEGLGFQVTEFGKYSTLSNETLGRILEEATAALADKENFEPPINTLKQRHGAKV